MVLSLSAVSTPAVIVAVTTSTIQTQSGPNGNLSMDKLSTVATQVSPGCYSGYVAMNITWTNSNVTYPITLQSFFIVIAVPNTVVSNSTSVSYVTPSNTIPSLLIFPNLPVTLRVSFQRVCGTPSTLRLIYTDSTFHFIFNLP